MGALSPWHWLILLFLLLTIGGVTAVVLITKSSKNRPGQPPVVGFGPDGRPIYPGGGYPGPGYPGSSYPGPGYSGGYPPVGPPPQPGYPGQGYPNQGHPGGPPAQPGPSSPGGM